MKSDKEPHVTFLLNCWVCGMPYESIKAGSRSCRKPECRATLADLDSLMLGQFILGSMRCYGGPGWELGERAPTMYPSADPVRELMERAIKELPMDEGLLAELLIELLCS
jgi:hypothetical protein